MKKRRRRKKLAPEMGLRGWYVRALYAKIAFGVVTGVIVCLLVALLASSAKAEPVATGKAVRYQYRTTEYYKNGGKAVSLAIRPVGGKKWTRKVVIKYNHDYIPSFGVAVGEKAAKALRAMLRKAADMSWGASYSLPKKPTKSVVVWQFRFHHYYRGSDGKMRFYGPPITFRIRCYQNKKGKIVTQYYSGSCKVSRYQIQTLLMKQSTTVDARLGTYVPNVR